MDAAIRRHVEQLPVYRHARTVAVFLEFDGEPAMSPLLTSAGARGKQFVVPVLRQGRMRFHAVGAKLPRQRNAFGIREPFANARTPRPDIDLVLTPLVAFDRHGTRIGVGGGYYDRYFAGLRAHSHWLRPKLVGIAYSFQEVSRLHRESWDVPLWGVVDEHGFARCTGG